MNHKKGNYKVFISREIPDNAYKLLFQIFNVDVWQKKEPPTPTELIERSRDCDAILSMLSDKIDSSFIDACPKLKVISNYAVGFNNIDIEYGTKKKIWISNTPDVLTEATAELTLALLLSVSRRVLSSYESIKKGQWKRWEPLGFRGPSLERKTLGIVGMGRIGLNFAKKCQSAFNMKILYCSPSPKVEADQMGMQLTPFNEMLPQCDIISLHCPLNKETKGLFQKEQFLLMKKGSIFLNTSRGELHNEKDLTDALLSNHLDGAGLDVTNPEPISVKSPLLEVPNVIITPHIGSATFEARKAMAELSAKNIQAALLGKDPLTPVNKI